MKYIKKFESFYYNDIIKLCQYICNFFNKNCNDSIKIKYDFEEYYSYYSFSNMFNKHKRKHLFKFQLIDHYFGDIDRFFSFTRANNIFLTEYEIEIVEFVQYVISKYKKQDMISFYVIPNIISEFTEQNFNYYLDVIRNTKKYNL